MRTVSFKLSDAKIRHLERLAKESGLSFDEVLRAAIDNAIKDEGWLLSQNKPLIARLRRSRKDQLAGRNQVSWDAVKRQHGL